jgi:hypothetical protein
MAVNDFQNIKQGTSSAENSVERLLLFFEEYLPDFSKSHSLNGIMSEEDLSEELYEYLTCKSMTLNLPFAFKSEKKQKKKGQKGHSRRVDFGIYYVQDNTLDMIYTLEAKKLPTGTGEREKEYVLSNHGGGIERFKNGLHGIDKQGNLLDRNGIIAYVYNDDFSTWHNKINTWIEEALWNTSEQLNKEYFDSIGKLNSTHLRISEQMVYLDHFWIKIHDD